MSAKRVVDTKATVAAPAPEIRSGKELGDLKAQIQEAIAHRAYEFYEARGHQHGLDLQDWFRSETELLHPLKVDTWQSEKEITVTAEIPGFTPEELKIGLEPRSVLLWAQVGPGQDRTGTYPARAPLALLHTVDLPGPIEPSKASAAYTDGLLKLILPRAGAGNGAGKTPAR